ncbi:lysine--tRNA ligase [bacterium]|nr:lysine--tRNA ligase [bacterium]
MASPTPRHWADKCADLLLAERGNGPFLIASGISPSGKIHVGNLREVLTADIIHRVLSERGVQSRLIFVADDYDPLRKVYPFLDAAVYAKHIGAPLSAIPCPCGGHKSYAQHFLEPFFASLRTLKIAAEPVLASELYASGALLEQTLIALKQRDAIAEILNRVTGKEIEPGWSPFMALCSSCGSMARTAVTGWSETDRTITYTCATCAIEKTAPIVGAGKLTWRVDWPARWAALRVGIEPFGKDHGGKGGSYDTGKEIVAKLFDWQAPFPVIYEWIRLKGLGDMSSSKGNVVSVDEVLDVIPPDVLRYFITRPEPKASLALDPVAQMLNLVDEVDDETKKQRDARSVELSQAGGFVPIGIPFNHLINVWQVAQGSLDTAKTILARTGYHWSSDDALAQRCRYAANWLERFAPDEYKFSLAQTLPESAKQFDAAQKKLAALVADRLAALPKAAAEDIHRVLYEVATENGIGMGDLCRLFYQALIGKDRGPRAGWFAEIIGVDFVCTRLREAAA